MSPTLLLLLACGGSAEDGDDSEPAPTGITETATPPTGDTAPDTSPPTPAGPHNLLILLTDDQGTDKVSAYGEVSNAPPTPNIDALAAEGLLFRNAWGMPVCSPARAALLTGRLGRRTGLGSNTQYLDGLELPIDEVILPEVLRHADPPYSDAALGKWHIGAYNGPHGIDHAVELGFTSWAGSIGNLYDRIVEDGQIHNYSHWEKIVDGEVTKTDTYATTDTVDDALAKMGELPEPWFLYVAFNAPHKPLSNPPEHLVDEPIEFGEPDVERYPKVVQALDNEIGRLMAEMDPEVRARTTIVFASDNGSPDYAIVPPRVPAQGKDSPFEGGVNVPLIVVSPLVTQPGTETDALVHLVDILPTFADIAGVPLSGAEAPPDLRELDGVSFLPVLSDPSAGPRDVVFTEKLRPNGMPPYDTDWRISRDERFKIIWTDGSGPLYFDLQGAYDDGVLVDPETLPAAEKAQVDALWATHQAYWDAIPPPELP